MIEPVDIARIISPSAFAEVRRRKPPHESTGRLRYPARERSRQQALAKAETILALIREAAP